MNYKLFCLFVSFVTSSYSISAQSYSSAIGAKLGNGIIASYKKFISDDTALDIFAGIPSSNSLTGGIYYQIHRPIPDIENFFWYYGGGASVFLVDNSSNNYIEIGAAGNIGIDYAFNSIPLNLSLDYSPTLVLLSTSNADNKQLFRLGYAYLTARYILNK